MRISEETKTKLVALAKKYFGENCRIYLFGSRVDDSKKGGDIDLFIETDLQSDSRSEMSFLVEAERSITQRKIDLVVRTPDRKKREIFETARNTGELLC